MFVISVSVLVSNSIVTEGVKCRRISIVAVRVSSTIDREAVESCVNVWERKDDREDEAAMERVKVDAPLVERVGMGEFVCEGTRLVRLRLPLRVAETLTVADAVSRTVIVCECVSDPDVISVFEGLTVGVMVVEVECE